MNDDRLHFAPSTTLPTRHIIVVGVAPDSADGIRLPCPLKMRSIMWEEVRLKRHPTARDNLQELCSGLDKLTTAYNNKIRQNLKKQLLDEPDLQAEKSSLRTDISLSLHAVRMACKEGKIILEGVGGGATRLGATLKIHQLLEENSNRNAHYNHKEIKAFFDSVERWLREYFSTVTAVERERLEQLRSTPPEKFPAIFGLDPAQFVPQLSPELQTRFATLVCAGGHKGGNTSVDDFEHRGHYVYLNEFTARIKEQNSQVPQINNAQAQAYAYMLAGLESSVGSHPYYKAHLTRARITAIISHILELNFDMDLMRKPIVDILKAEILGSNPSKILLEKIGFKNPLALNLIIADLFSSTSRPDGGNSLSLHNQPWLFSSVRFLKARCGVIDRESEVCVAMANLTRNIPVEQLHKTVNIADWLDTFGNLKRRESLKTARQLFQAILDSLQKNPLQEGEKARSGEGRSSSLSAVLSHFGRYAKLSELDIYLLPGLVPGNSAEIMAKTRETARTISQRSSWLNRWWHKNQCQLFGI